MNAQDILNSNYQWFIVEKHNRAGDGAQCFYRMDNGNRCAIGCVMPDEVYDEDMDISERGGKILVVLDNFPLADEFFKETDLSFLYDLQSAHDGYAAYKRVNDSRGTGSLDFHSYYDVELRKLAQKYSLVYPEKEQ